MIGDTLLHYRILSKLGEGGMGEVYLAEDTRLGRRIALKVLPRSRALDRDHLERFEREAKAVAALDHPNIVTVYSVDEADGVHFITMGLVEGQTLRERIPEHGMSALELLEVAVPLADALAAAHQRGIVHRDLKPANVMISDDGRVKVLDFGLAKLRTDALADGASRLPTASASPELTGPGSVLGTLPYMSPEQVEGKPVDWRTDIFSFGVMLHEMALGKRPFDGDSVAALTSSILRDEPASMAESKPDYPRRFARIVRRCLAKDPIERYQSALDLRYDLEELAEDLDAPESGASVSEVAGRVPASSNRSAPSSALWLASVGAALVLGAAGYWLLDRARASDAAPAPVRLEQLTTAPPQELFPSLSPDGQYVAYASPTAGNWDIYLLRIGGDKPVNLTEGSLGDDIQPAFSPDGQSIAFRSERDGGGLFVMGATGESVRRVAENGFHPDWSPDGTRLVHSTGEAAFDPYGRGEESRLRIVDLASGASRLLIDRDATQPRWSPDGEHIAYWGLVEGGNRELFTVTVDGGEPTPIAPSPYIDWSPSWSADGSRLYFSSDRGGSMNLWRVEIDERTGRARGEPEPLTFAVGAEVWHATVSRQGDGVVYASYSATKNLQRLPLTAELRPKGSPTWFTQGSGSAAAPSLSDDGWIAYRIGNPFDLVISKLDGTNRLQLTNDPFRDAWPRWSPSSERLAFQSNRDGATQIWAAERDGSGFERLTHFEDRQVLRPVWSPDGSRLAFSGDANDGYRAYVVDLTRPWADQEIAALRIPDTMEFFQTHDWSAEGQRLAGIFRDDQTQGIAVYSLEDQRYEIVAREVTARFPIVRWADRDRVVWSQGSTVNAVDVQSGNTWQVLSVAPDEIVGLDLTSDGSELFFDRRSEQSDLWLLKLETR